MYKAHCQRILDSVVRANFHEVRQLISSQFERDRLSCIYIWYLHCIYPIAIGGSCPVYGVHAIIVLFCKAEALRSQPCPHTASFWIALPIRAQTVVSIQLYSKPVERQALWKCLHWVNNRMVGGCVHRVTMRTCTSTIQICVQFMCIQT